jgi:sec-independent protein translocase protein TatB|tara:strand:- start:69 stop:305 length:237 start_codon:yes stop_codon:yes gene_type:complete
MPQIGWLEILSVVIIAILVLGPKEFPIALKKIGLFIGKFKNTISNFQREVTSVTKDVDLDEDLIPKNDKIKKDTNKNG